jgi:hypothetical protein
MVEGGLSLIKMKTRKIQTAKDLEEPVFAKANNDYNSIISNGYDGQELRIKRLNPLFISVIIGMKRL